MWSRSEIETLIGLSKRKIQELCHQNKRTGGIAFWQPYESRPGYSNFDSTDLEIFYIVRRLYLAGFSLSEIPEAFEYLVLLDRSNKSLLISKEKELKTQLKEVSKKLENLEALSLIENKIPEHQIAEILEVGLFSALIKARNNVWARYNKGKENTVVGKGGSEKWTLFYKMRKSNQNFESKDCLHEMNFLKQVFERIEKNKKAGVSFDSEEMFSSLRIVIEKYKLNQFQFGLEVFNEFLQSTEVRISLEILSGRETADYVCESMRSYLKKCNND